MRVKAEIGIVLVTLVVGAAAWLGIHRKKS